MRLCLRLRRGSAGGPRSPLLFFGVRGLRAIMWRPDPPRQVDRRREGERRRRGRPRRFAAGVRALRQQNRRRRVASLGAVFAFYGLSLVANCPVMPRLSPALARDDERLSPGAAMLTQTRAPCRRPSRLGLPVSPLKARLFDVVARAGADGIAADDLFAIVFADRRARRGTRRVFSSDRNGGRELE